MSFVLHCRSRLVLPALRSRVVRIENVPQCHLRRSPQLSAQLRNRHHAPQVEGSIWRVHKLDETVLNDENDKNSSFDQGADPSMLIDLARMEMPFGRFKGRVLIDLPEPYVVWFHTNGFPKGRLGKLLGMLYEVKVNGLEPLFDQMRDPPRKPRLEFLEGSIREQLKHKLPGQK